MIGLGDGKHSRTGGKWPVLLTMNSIGTVVVHVLAAVAGLVVVTYRTRSKIAERRLIAGNHRRKPESIDDNPLYLLAL